MKNLFNKSNLPYFIPLLVFFIMQLLLVTTVPDIMEDEPWYANTAYNLSEGVWFTNTNVGHYGGDFLIIYTMLLGFGIKIFGCTLFVTRFVSILGGLVAVWGIMSILHRLRIKTFLIILSTCMFIFSNVIYIVSRTVRPESWILGFGIWSIYFLVKYHQNKEVKSVIFAALLSTLSFLVHPNGMLFIMNSGLFFLIYAIKEKRISPLLYYVGSVILLAGLYFVIAFSTPNFAFQDFIAQILWRNSLSESDYSVFVNISNFGNNYTLGVKRLYILIFEIGILILGLIFSKKGSLLRYITIFGLLNLFLSLFLFSYYGFRHFGEIISFSLLGYALLTESIKLKKYKLILIASGILYLLNNLAGDIYVIYKKHHNTSYAKIEHFISSNVPDHSVVLADIHFWYPLCNTEFYCDFTRFDLKEKYESLDQLLNSNNLDYIVISKTMLKGETGTSGRPEEISDESYEFYQKTIDYACSNGDLMKSLYTVGFDTIKIFKINTLNDSLIE